MDIDVLVRAEQLVSAIQVARAMGFDLPARKMTTEREAIDMSATAIARRLEQVRALYKLMVSLSR